MKKRAAKKAKQNFSGETREKDFLVVGLGASAGGVKALQEFFASMPPNSGMAFVVILHLSPQHESALPQILQVQTTMPVVQVKADHKVEPNHVYVMPPNSQLKIANGKIHRAPPEKKIGARVAIDVFFRTLAEAYQRNAVCIVLSGTGSDGTLGLKRVKESNGFAIVQSPEDAEYDQMPRNAIATGLADWVLPVRQMPEKLIHFRESSERLHLTNGADAEKVAEKINAEDSLREILTILRLRTGHDFTNYKKPTLVRRIARHLQIHELEDLPAYVKYLRDNQKEIQSLQRNLLINVTNFFRDREAFAALEAEVVPQLFADKTARDTVRVWTAGCASGEEAYSMAMLLTEYAEKQSAPPKIMVFATDIDDEAIAQAREHLYPETIETDVSPERLKRFFLKDGSRYRIKKELRETVLLAPHNILRDPPFSRLDLISCRNLLIYFNQEAQKRVMEIFHFALNPDGCLFLGSSESADGVPELFEAINKKQRVYRRRSAAPHGYQLQPRLLTDASSQHNLPIAEKFADRVKAPSLGEVHFKLLENLVPPSILVNENFEVVYMSQSVGRYLHFTGGEPTNNLLKLVNADLLPDLRAVLFTAQRDRQPAEFSDLRIRIDGRETFINVCARPVSDATNGDFLLVIFDETAASLPKTRRKKSRRKNAPSAEASENDGVMAAIVNRLEDELQRARLNLRATVEQHEVSIEELKASNEELQAINEELRSATEELETSKEELQSVNEEMNTVNGELKDKIEESSRANSDLQNLIVSTDIATIFLDRKLHIKRFSPLVERLFNITPTDIGRPLEHFTHRLEYQNLTADAAEVLKTLKTVEREISDTDNRYFLTRFSPYRTTDDRIEGVVLNFLEITKYKKAEAELQKAQEKYRAELEREVEARTRELKESRDELASRSRFFETVLSTITDFAYQFDREGRFVYVNQPLLDLWGLKEEEAVGKNFYQLGYPDELAEKLHRQIKRVFKTGKPLRDETAYTSPTGAGGFYEYIFAPLKDAKGKVQSVVGSTRDITAHKKSETAASRVERSLHESEERLRIAVEAAELATWIWDLRKNEVVWNEQHYKLLGLEPRENPQSPDLFFEHIHPADRRFVTERLEKAIKNNTTYSAEFRIVRKDGATRWMEGYGHVVETEKSGKPVKASGVMSDITSRRRAEIALRESESRLQLLMESVTDYAIITTDLRGVVTDWNKGAENIFGWQAKEIIGQSAEKIFTPEDRAAGVPEKEMQVALRKGRAEDERFHLRKDGTRFYVSGMMTPLRNGEVEGFVKIARDQTAKMRAEKDRQETETLRRLIAGQEDERRRIARDIHDHFGQRLTALRLKLDNARKICDDKKICDEVEQAQTIAQNLDADVDFIAWELRPAALDDLGLRITLNNFVREWSHHTKVRAEFHSSGLGRKNLAFETETNLYRIAQEALNNIYKHAKASRVDVILERRKDTLVLIVEDDGIGFNPKSSRAKDKGMGLGGMRERAAVLGGTLDIESEKGKGTTVFARVPAKFAD